MTPKVRGLICGIVFAATLLALILAQAQSPSPQDTLNQYVSDLQRNPSDTALPEKIIELVLTMDPKPTISSEAERFSDRAEYVVKNAKTEADFADATKEYEKALLAAPWVADYYFNLGVVEEKANQPQQAVSSFQLYLLAAPDAKDAREVRKRIAGLEYAAEKAAKESSPQAIAPKKQNEFDDWLKKLDGRRYTCPVDGSIAVIDVRGRVFVFGDIRSQVYSEGYHSEIRGRETTVPEIGFMAQWWKEFTCVISEDGDRIAVHEVAYNGQTRDYIYLWQR